jgi:hypothetical protein
MGFEIQRQGSSDRSDLGGSASRRMAFVHRFRQLIVLSIAIVILAIVSLLGLYRASQAVPEFYELALKQETTAAGLAGDELERRVVAMSSDLNEGNHWELILTDEQVNGWLATDLETKFPNLLPRQVHEPRVAFQDQAAHVACRLDSQNVSTVLSLKLEAYLTDRANEIAVRVRRVRAGVLPVPLTKILDQITAAAHQSGVTLHWSQQDGDPVALVALPVERPELRSGVVLQQLTMGTGKIVVSGTADDVPPAPSEPVGQPRVAESTADGSISQR